MERSEGGISTKSELLTILKESGDSFVSGQEIGEKFGITRAAVWKGVKQLQEDGYRIESAHKKGYRLVRTPDILTGGEIREYLHTAYIGRRILHYDAIDSTNRITRELAEAGEPEGTVVIAEGQTKGKGKTGRPWYSQAYRGIWMSVLLRPRIPMSSVNLITQIGCAAVGICAERSAERVQIKWPNDVLINGKKFCGVLTESFGEMDETDYVVCGIGINVNQCRGDFRDDLAFKATSLKIEAKKEIKRQELTAAVLNELETHYDRVRLHRSAEEALDFCRTHSTVLGKTVVLTKNGKRVTARATELNDQGQMVVRYGDGTTENILGGEIAVLP